MLPTINGKSFLECNIDDLKTILDNTDFKESEYLDYKKSFELTEIPKTQKDALDKAKAEFRKDVCAFANAQGGYLIYGIKEDGKAVPHELVGIEISDNNTEQFENLVKNTLQTISPRIPNFELKYIPRGDNFVVILYIHKDSFAPYIFLENNRDYRIYRRVGNSVSVLAYSEIKSMFSQSVILEKEIGQYRKERINLFYDGEAAFHEQKFFLLHMIPETFLDSSYDTPIFFHCRKGVDFSGLFTPFGYINRPIPTVAGIRYVDKKRKTECRLQNNGIAEVYSPVGDYIDFSESHPEGFLFSQDLWENIELFVRAYAEKSSFLAKGGRVFAGLSIVGCKNIRTDNDWMTAGYIERHMLICEPVVFVDMADEDQLETDIKTFELETLLSLGVHSEKRVNELMLVVYGSERIYSDENALKQE